MIILKRLDVGMERLLQCRFRRNRSCIDQIYSIRTIIINCIEFNIPLYYVNFIDFKAAFDSIRREFMWSSLRHYGLPEKYVRSSRHFSTEPRVLLGLMVKCLIGSLSTRVLARETSRVLQISVFNFETFLAEVNKAISHGAILQKELKGVEEKVVMDTDYANDMAVMDNTDDGLQESTDLIAHYSTYDGLKISAKKTHGCQ